MLKIIYFHTFWTKSLKFGFICYTGSMFHFGLATFQVLRKHAQLLAPALNTIGTERKGCWPRRSKTRVAPQPIAETVFKEFALSWALFSSEYEGLD